MSFGYQLLHELGMRIGEPVHQALGFMTRQQFVRVLLDQLRKMRRQHRGVVHHRISSGDGLRLQIGRDPLCGRVECRLPRLLPGQIARLGVGIHRQQTIAAHLPARNLHAAQIDHILSLFQRQIVGDVNRRNQESQLSAPDSCAAT